ncbi:MAG: hypothetical protein ACK46I_04930 [Phycisphaerae bacterium]
MSKFAAVLTLAAGTLSTTAIAQPTLTSLGGGAASNITNAQGGVIYLGGQSGTQGVRWNFNPGAGTLTSTLIGGIGGGEVSLDGQASTVVFANTGPSIRGNTATGIAPAFSIPATLVASTNQPADTEQVSRVWSSVTNTVTSMGGLPIVNSLGVFGSGSSGSSSGNFLSGHGISSTGQFVVGQAYVSTYNNAGTAVSANSFRWRPFIWNATTGTHTVLPTPFRTTSSTSLRRTGNAYAVSTDGSVVVGATEHNVGGSNDDSGRLCVWRFNIAAGAYELTYLDDGRVSSTPSSVAMNAAGSIIVGRGESGINKWTWNVGTNTWDRTTLFTGLTPTPSPTSPSWLASSVLAPCPPANLPGPLPPSLGGVIAMNDDASIIVGQASWSTCGSFISGGFIYTAASGVAQDWHDYLVFLNAPGVAPGGLYGPIGEPGNSARGNPRSGSPVAISPDGNNVYCQILGPQFIPGAAPYILNFTGGPTCVAPSVVTSPSNTTFSACSSNIILNVSASGTGPFTDQWFKDGSPINNGTTASGSTVTGANDLQLRIAPPLTPADVGSYYAVITGQCGTPAQSASASVTLDPAFATPAANDTCGGAQVVALGTNVLGTGQSPCSAYINDEQSNVSCITSGGTKTDRWYAFTPATSGNYRFETCGANFDTVITLFDGCGSFELACNDNYATGPVTGCTNSRSRIASVALTAGQSYRIRLAAPSAAFLSATSQFNLTIAAAPAAAANDNCSNAAVAVIGPNAFDLLEASHEFAPSCNASAARDVWFVFQAPAQGLYKFSTCGTTLNTVLSLYDACGGSEFGCNDNAGITGCSNQSIIDNYGLSANALVYIRVGANNTGVTGTGNVTIERIGCDDIDFNNNTVFPEDQDVIDFFTVLAGGTPTTCDPTAGCNDIDFNNNTVFPEDQDVLDFSTVLAGGSC